MRKPSSLLVRKCSTSESRWPQLSPTSASRMPSARPSQKDQLRLLCAAQPIDVDSNPPSAETLTPHTSGSDFSADDLLVSSSSSPASQPSRVTQSDKNDDDDDTDDDASQSSSTSWGAPDDSFAMRTPLKQVTFAADTDTLQQQLCKLQTRYAHEKERRRRNERALVKLAKELSKRNAAASTGVEFSDDKTKGVADASLLSSHDQKYSSIFVLVSISVGMTIGWYFGSVTTGWGNDEAVMSIVC